LVRLHFGVTERITLLQSIASEELKEVLSQDDKDYINSLSSPIVDTAVEVDQNIE
jgi:hypothetical protein